MAAGCEPANFGYLNENFSIFLSQHVFFIIIITTIFLQVWMENNEAKETYYSSYTKRILFRMWIDPEPDKNNLNI